MSKTYDNLNNNNVFLLFLKKFTEVLTVAAIAD